MKYSKLTPNQIAEISEKTLECGAGYPRPSKFMVGLAAEYNVTIGTIQKIVNAREEKIWEQKEENLDIIKKHNVSHETFADAIFAKPEYAEKLAIHLQMDSSASRLNIVED